MPDDASGVRVGMIDADVSLAGIAIAAASDFCDPVDKNTSKAMVQHGNGVARTIAAHCPQAVFSVARVFGDSPVCRPEQVAEAIHWLVRQRVRLVNMSFGLRHDRQVLREACELALSHDICLVSASPAQGQGVYPALYPGVVRATGDARCRPGQVSWLDSEQADFGACPGRPGDAFIGASAGCAAVAGAIAGIAVENPAWSATELILALKESAAYIGPENRAGQGVEADTQGSPS